MRCAGSGAGPGPEARECPGGRVRTPGQAARAPSPSLGALLSGPATTPRSACPGGATATSVDAFVDGVHFRREDASPAIGHKGLAAALSDLAAMGAAPGEAYVVLGVPDDLDENGCLELLEGSRSWRGRPGPRWPAGT